MRAGGYEDVDKAIFQWFLGKSLAFCKSVRPSRIQTVGEITGKHGQFSHIYLFMFSNLLQYFDLILENLYTIFTSKIHYQFPSDNIYTHFRLVKKLSLKEIPFLSSGNYLTIKPFLFPLTIYLFTGSYSAFGSILAIKCSSMSGVKQCLDAS